MKAIQLLTKNLLSGRSFRYQSTQNSQKCLRTLGSIIHGNKVEYTSYEDALSIIESNMDVHVQGMSCAPTELLEEMCNQVDSGRLSDIRVSHVLIQGNVPWKNPKYYGKIRSNCLFICDNMRKMVNEGHADCTPIFLSDIAKLYSSFTLPVDVAIISVTPPDEFGYCSMSVSLDCSVSAVCAAKKIIALVNDTLPQTYGDSLIHSSHFDKMVRTSRPIYSLSEEAKPKIGEVEKKIGQLIAETLVDDGATMQMGIGGIPDATLSQMVHHRDLGIHTELFGDGVIDLVKRGVITNTKKTVDPGKIVSSFAFGTRGLYNFIHKNPLFLFKSCAYTNDTQVIRKQHKMVAINSAIELDLTGQVSADSIGTRFYSGFGGQVDYIYGTAVADDGEGKPIIAMPSVTAKGQSRIVPFLKEGAGVVTTRGHIRYVVTEYGIAQLWGKTVRQRAYELIQIAHPEHRESLEKAAFERLKCMPDRHR